MFVDKITLKLLAGKGGNGVVAWRREKYIRKGGPAGGNGGKGGSVILESTSSELSLESYRNRRILKAENGKQGGSAQKQGRGGKDLFIRVPSGTLVKDSLTGELLFDFTENGQQWVACLGGRGGRGNTSFKSPTNRAPNTCTEGLVGVLREVDLELKIIADVGLVGFPNAGKSTLMSSLAYVNVKTAPYPFTTLRPNVGYVEFDDFSRILIADIPGIIKGAHQNRGLGYEFLRHIERTKVLVYILDASGIDGRNPVDDFHVLREELASYSKELRKKPFLVLLNKMDTEEAKIHAKEFHKQYASESFLLLEISALNKDGLPKLLNTLQSYFA